MKTDFTLSAAQQHARDGKLEEWIHHYLTTGAWANSALSDGLKLQKRWWIGPTRMPLTALTRCCGPEPTMEFVQPVDRWEQRVTHIADGLNRVEDLPPLIVQYHADAYNIRDGNHRHEAMRRKDWMHCWVLIWFDNVETWQAHQL